MKKLLLPSVANIDFEPEIYTLTSDISTTLPFQLTQSMACVCDWKPCKRRVGSMPQHLLSRRQPYGEVAHELPQQGGSYSEVTGYQNEHAMCKCMVAKLNSRTSQHGLNTGELRRHTPMAQRPEMMQLCCLNGQITSNIKLNYQAPSMRNQGDEPV